MKVLIVQLNPIVGALEGNAANIFKTAKSVFKRVDLIVTPELSLLGYPPRDLLLYKSFISEAWDYLLWLAKETEGLAPILVGTAVPTKGKGKPLKNAAVLLKDGKVEKIFGKSLLPSYDVFDEDRYFEQEKNAQVLNLNGKRIGISICEDLWNDKDFWGDSRYHIDPINRLVKEKVDLIVNLSASPFTLYKQDLREKMIASSAKKYSIPIVYVNQVGGNDHLVFDGASVVFDEKGVLVARAKAFKEDELFVDFSKNIKSVASYPHSAEERLFMALTLGLGDYIRKTGFKKVIIGLSGGIDSSLVAAIAVRALGSRNVIGVLMPSPYTAKDSLLGAKRLANNLGIKILNINIEPLMESFDAALASSFKGYPRDVTEENIQSRIRSNLLMAISNKYNAMLLSTGNKSELTVGYTTLYGDLSGALAVIGDLSKTQVYLLSNWLNKKWKLIPSEILRKAPSAELKPNQTDQDVLPAYETLDRIIFEFIENQKSREEIIEEGFDKEIVNRVIDMLNKSEFKRRQAPPVIKVTEKAFGSGWRMPIAAKKEF